MQSPTLARFRDWFWHPPRAHGETIEHRTVSNLELLYDLVYVACIGQAASALASDVNARSIVDFTAVFAMIWIAWVNGSLYVELHGRQDGRTRTFVFLQIGILAFVAVFTGAATGDTGRQFALVYALFLVVNLWLWYSVRRRDRPEYLPVTGAWNLLMAASVVVIGGSAFLPGDVRLVVWVVYDVAWIGAMKVLGYRSRMFELGVRPSDSMVERFGLFTIIVLGEVVIGVVDGLSQAEQDALTFAIGGLGLVVGFGFWWTYFDVIGRRLPRPTGPAVADWIIFHFPITLAIAGAGAGMVSLLEHAHEAVTPAPTAWLLSGAVAIGLAGVAAAALALEDASRLPAVYRPLAGAMAAGALVSLLVGWLAPAPWLLAALLAAVLSVLWAVIAVAFFRAGAWAEAEAALE